MKFSSLSVFRNTSHAGYLKEMFENGAVIIDVRTSVEFKSAHLNNSINIPFKKIETKLHTIEKINAPIIIVSERGARSSLTVQLLKKLGVESFNGGPWKILEPFLYK